MGQSRIGEVLVAVAATLLTAASAFAVEAPEFDAASQRRFLAADLNADEVLTGKEMQATAPYDDADRDGSITQAEFLASRQAERRILAEVIREREAEEGFLTRDITEDENLTGKEKVGVEKYDTDGDGRVSKIEYRIGRVKDLSIQTAPAAVTSTGGDSVALFTAADSNEDGKLTGNELTAGYRKFDADGDGRVSRPEFEAGIVKIISKPLGSDSVPQPGDKAEEAAIADDAERFRQRDGNEDGRLSGLEVLGSEAYDVDLNGRVTREEYLAGRAGDRSKQKKPPGSITEKPVADKAAAGAGDTATRFDAGKVFLIFIGVSKYPSDPLPCGAPDVRAIEVVLDKINHPPEKVKAIGTIDDDPNLKNHPSKKVLRIYFTNPTVPAPADLTVVFFFSGRIATLDGRSYLCPLEFDPAQPAQTGVSLDEVAEMLATYGDARKLLLIDGRPFHVANDQGIRVAAPDFERALGHVSGLTTILSCSADEAPLESPTLSHGLFSDAVAAAMSGRADFDGNDVLDADELFVFLKLAIPHGAGFHTPEGRQSPKRIVGPGLAGAFGVFRTKIKASEADDSNKPATPTSPQPAAETNFVTNSIGMRMRHFPPADVTVGASDVDPDYRDSEQQQIIPIKLSFYVGVHEVTQSQFKQVMGRNPSHFVGDDPDASANLPVEQVDWNEAVEFCAKLAKLPAELEAGRAYRLPTECEWEYACAGTRAGEKRGVPFHFGEIITSAQANIRGDRPFRDSPLSASLGRTQPVGSYPANEFGLFDMHGNVAEWCYDWHADDRFYLKESITAINFSGPVTGIRKAMRGGDFACDVAQCRTVARRSYPPDYRYRAFGFRVLCIITKRD